MANDNGLTDFRKICVMWGVKIFFSPIGEGEDEQTIAARLQHQIQLSIDKQDKVVVKRSKYFRSSILET